jgi:hypothetical protein
MQTKENILELESRKCFEFFWNEANQDMRSRGFGLIRDRAPGGGNISSIASVGFGLTSIIVAVERGWISFEEGFKRTLGTLNTLLNNVEHIRGFFYHFIDMENGKRAFKSEVSIIDTAVAVCGALTAGEYFQGIIRETAFKIYKRIDWQWYRDPVREQFYMGFSPERGFCGWWDFYAEHLMVYFLAAASPTFPVSGDMFYKFQRNICSIKGLPPFINSWFGSLFTHQFSHGWFDLRDKVDKMGVNWWDNSVSATLANRQFCIEQSSKYKTYGEKAWGLTACDGPRGYCGRYGSAPSAIFNNEHSCDGTVPPCGAAGSIVFAPQYSIEALNYYYYNHPGLWGRYGFNDAYNIDAPGKWFCQDVIGIDKGITLVMIENYRTGLIWDLFMKNEFAQKGLINTGLEKTFVKEVS